MKKLLTLIASTISIFALVSCNDVDTSSTTSVVTSSSSSQITSVSSDTSLVETSSETDGEDFDDESSSSNPPEESSTIEEQSSSIEESSSIEQSSSVEEHSSLIEESSSSEESSSEESQESSIQVTYHVRFVNYDDSLLYETDVAEGEGATYRGETPTRANEGDSTFEFLRWDKDFSSVTSDLTVKAVFAEFVIDDGGWSPIIWF